MSKIWLQKASTHNFTTIIISPKAKQFRWRTFQFNNSSKCHAMANPTNGSACFVEMHLNTFQHDSAVDKLEMSNICSDTGYLAVSNNKKKSLLCYFLVPTLFGCAPITVSKLYHALLICFNWLTLAVIVPTVVVASVVVAWSAATGAAGLPWAGPVSVSIRSAVVSPMMDSLVVATAGWLLRLKLKMGWIWCPG